VNPELWKCPKCGARLVSRNLSHSCGPHSVEAFLAGAGPGGRSVFLRFVRAVGTCGPYETMPAKTRVAFMAQVRFASVNRVTDQWIDVHFVLPRQIRSPRFRRVERLGKLFVHHLRLASAGDFDPELEQWLQASYREYGERRWLRKPARPAHKGAPPSLTSSDRRAASRSERPRSARASRSER